MNKMKAIMIISFFFLCQAFLQIDAARPTVKISATPATINAGGSSTLAWTSSGATSAAINNGIGAVPINGSRVVIPTKTATYTITVRNSSGSATAKATVTVKAAPPTVTFSAAPSSISPGQSSTLSWTTVNATSASINQNIGTVSLNGTKVVKPGATKTYTITVKGSGGTVTANATVTVASMPPTVTIAAEPLSIQPGTSSTLSWASTNAASAQIDNGVGSVALNGSKTVWPEDTTTYTIIVSGTGGTASAGATVSIISIQPKIYLKAFPASVVAGEAATLCWWTENSDSVSIDNGVGAVAPAGTIQVTPASSTTYTLTATNAGTSSSAVVTVSVDNTLQPSASMYASTEIVAAGGAVFLSWSSLHAQSASIDHGIGNVPLNGSLCITPTQSTTYTLTAANANGIAATAVKINIKLAPRCYAYVPSSNDSTVAVVNTLYSGSLIKTLAVGSQPKGSVVAPDGTQAYIGNTASRSLSVIDTGSNTVVSSIGLDGAPKYLVFHPAGRHLYATLEKTSSYAIAVIDTANGQIVKELDLGGDALGGIALHPDGSRLYVADCSGNKVIVLDTVSNEVIYHIPLRAPLELAVSPDGNRLYAIQGYDGFQNNVSVVNLVANTIVSSLLVKLANNVPASLLAMELLPDGSKLFVSISDDGSVSVIDTATLQVKRAESFAGFSPRCLATHPDGSRIYVVFTGSNNLVYYLCASHTIGGWLSLGDYPYAYGNFLGYMAETAAGKVTQNNAGVAGVTLTVTGEGSSRTMLTDVSGNYITALKSGTYTVTPTKGNAVFSPQSRQVLIEQSLSGLDFAVIDPAVPPAVSLSASPATINGGSTATLTWSSTNAATAAIDNNVGAVPVSGSVTVSPETTTTYTITVSNTVLMATATAQVTVTSPPPTVTISASPAAIASGGSSTLTWASTNATTAAIDNGVGAVPVNGSFNVSPTATTTYTITATGAGGTANASVQVTVNNPFNTFLSGTVTDFSSSQPIPEVLVTALDSASQSKTALTDVAGKYTISSLAPGNVQVSFVKSGYDPYQQTINIPVNMTLDLTTQLRLTQVGATLCGLVKDGQTSLPIIGATVTVVFSGGSLSDTSGTNGAYALVGIPLNTTVVVTASANGYRNLNISQTFTQNAVIIYDFILYNNSVLATVNGKIANSKTLLPEVGVKVTHEGSNVAKETTADGTFIFADIPFGDQTFYFEKKDFVEETFTYTIDRTPFAIDLIKPSNDGGQITINQSVGGAILDCISQRPISGAKVRVPDLDLEAVTDANGNYQFTGLPIGNYPMMVIATNHMALNFMATVDINEPNRIDFVLIPLVNGLIKGILTDAASGEPVVEASIEIEGSTMLATTSEGDGTYKMIGVPPGSYTVLIRHEEYMEASVENVEVQDLTPTTFNIQLNKRPQTGTLAGRILDVNTGNPVSGATITVSGTSLTATTDVSGNYNLANVPAGLNNIIVSASGYPQSPRLRAVIADVSASSPSTTSSDIKIDINNSTVNEAVTAIISANEGGDIITQDSRFLLHIFPGTLSADARITLRDASDGPVVPIGSDLPLDPTLGIEGIKAASVMTQIEISSVNEGDPTPTINGLAAFSVRYAQKDTDAFQLDENTAFTYSWNGTCFTAMNPRPYELAVDKINNIVYSVMDLSKTIGDSTAQYSKRTLLTSDPVKSGAVMTFAATIIFKIIGKSIKNMINPPKPNMKIFDKNELDAVTTAPFKNIPNPNALPLLVIHGFDPLSFISGKETNPNKEERYLFMLQDIVDATNGVYRPVFVSYNTEAKISSIAQSLGEKLFGEFQNLNISFKGLPANPNNPASGTFPYLDTFGFSMGGLVSRTFIFFNKINRVHNMTMIGTPNHGTFNCLKYLFNNNSLFGVASNVVKSYNFGASDMLEYNDNNPIDGFNQNPFLFMLNSPELSPIVTPRGDINLFAGNDESAWMGLTNLFIASPHDSLVTVKSVFCRPTNATLGSKLSLLNVHKPKSEKYEHTKDFSHANVGKKDKRINEFIEEIVLGLSDWTVDRVHNENPLDNFFLKPTKDLLGYAKSKVKVEYNVWDGSEGRTARDFDRVVLVIYHKDGNGVWHISEPMGGENGADTNGNVNGAKVMSIKGNSKYTQAGNPLILNAVVNFEPNPGKNEAGYNPEKDIVETVSLVFPLKPGKMTVPLDPTKAHFRTPNLNE